MVDVENGPKMQISFNFRINNTRRKKYAIGYYIKILILILRIEYCKNYTEE